MLKHCAGLLIKVNNSTSFPVTIFVLVVQTMYVRPPFPVCSQKTYRTKSVWNLFTVFYYIYYLLGHSEWTHGMFSLTFRTVSPCHTVTSLGENWMLDEQVLKNGFNPCDFLTTDSGFTSAVASLLFYNQLRNRWETSRDELQPQSFYFCIFLSPANGVCGYIRFCLQSVTN